MTLYLSVLTSSLVPKPALLTARPSSIISDPLDTNSPNRTFSFLRSSGTFSRPPRQPAADASLRARLPVVVINIWRKLLFIAETPFKRRLFKPMHRKGTDRRRHVRYGTSIVAR